MTNRATLLSATLFLVAAGSAHAQKLALPVGEWGYSSSHGANCKRHILTIESTRIIQRLDEGEARCAVRKIKKKGKVLFVNTKCDWDASVPQGLRESPDQDDPDSFSIEIKGPNKILFNNSDYELCSSVGGAGK